MLSLTLSLLKALVRRACRDLMGRKTSSDPLPDCPPDNITRPTQEYYSFQWFEPIGSTFNLAAIDLLVAETLDQNAELNSTYHLRIREAALTHATHLQQTYRAACDDDYVEARLEQQRKAALKRDVSESLPYFPIPYDLMSSFRMTAVQQTSRCNARSSLSRVTCPPGSLSACWNLWHEFR